MQFCIEDTVVVGGLVVLKITSQVSAPVTVQDKMGLRLTPVAVSPGEGLAGVAGTEVPAEVTDMVSICNPVESVTFPNPVIVARPATVISVSVASRQLVLDPLK